ncbi:serine/threonine-protein kinase [Streptomyces spirodelae]|uniref:serine/threonine-protein kinase n=1 Tax=Streptomyces spirodelae TaxID=2812904 RepID=UPI0027DBB493|nr:serine/threonine-protein kinase [Streptomyces spirodelae]
MGSSQSSLFIIVSAIFVMVCALLVMSLLVARHRRRRQSTLPAIARRRPVARATTAAASRPHPPSAPTATLWEPGTATLSAGRFTLLEELGRGGMGVVWRARDGVLGRQVAIKQLLPPSGLSSDAGGAVRARMLREARAAAQLTHQNAVTIHDVLVDENSVLIVMELVKAVTLSATVERDGPLPPARVAAIGLDTLDVLSEAYDLGIVHRDIKPANLLVRTDGSIKLADFGIARFQGDPTLTEAGAIIGTPAYMAPEQIRGLNSSPATDLWGLGATLFYAVEGKPAFGRPSPTAAMAAVLTDPPLTPHRAGPSLSAVLTGLLAKDRKDRPTSSQLRSQLAGIVSHR